MSHPITVRDLSGHHLGQRIRITTAHTTAEGELQGFQHEADAINDGTPMRDSWVRGRTTTTITLLPGQDIIAELGDQVVVHDGGLQRYSAGGVIKDEEPRICDNRNAVHQAEMNGETAPTMSFPTGPRTVVIVHDITKFKLQGKDYIIYGRAITGWPVLKATVMESPRNDEEREWLDTYLPAYITPEGEIVHAYKEGTSGPGD